MHLVEQLLAHGVERDHPTGGLGLGDDGAAVGFDLGDREGDARGVRVFPPAPGVVAPGDLAAALEEMADDDAGRQVVPGVPGPAELVHERRQEQRRVGHPTRDHHLSPGGEGLDDRPGPEVGAGEQRIFWKTELAGPASHVVAHDRRHLEAARAERPGCADHGAPRGHGVDAPGVGDQPRAAVEDPGDGLLEVQGQVPRVPERLVALAVLLQDGEGQLGEGLAHEVVDAGFEQVVDGGVAVAVEPLSPTEANRHGTPAALVCASCKRVRTIWAMAGGGGGLAARKASNSGMAPLASLRASSRSRPLNRWAGG